MAYGFYDLFHYLDNPEMLHNQVDYSPRAHETILNSQVSEQGVVVLGVHMSSFDAVMQATAHKGLRAMALSLPQPDEAVEWQHNYRRKAGVEILPASVSNIRQIIRRLKDGETALTGLDRPMPNPKYRPRFFGRPANVPVHYIPLAIKAKVPVVVMAAIRRKDGTYQVLSSDYLELQPHTNRQAELVQNAEKVLRVAEGFIRQAPQQWAIVQPVWTDIVPI
jgi:KDO2-lipid IV(A) lauroyltransferase